MTYRSVWVAQSIKHLSLDLISGLDFRVVSLSLTLGSMLPPDPRPKKKKRYDLQRF